MKNNQFVDGSQVYNLKKSHTHLPEHINLTYTKQIEKSRNLIGENFVNKSASLANLVPFNSKSNYKNPNHSYKVSMESKDKLRSQTKKQTFSPEKRQERQARISRIQQIQERIDMEEKRRQVYNMGFMVQQIDNEEDELKLTSLSAPTSKSKSQMKSYTQTVSTTSSNKPHMQLKITDFQIGKILGLGKFGEVFMAKHIKSGFFCALKQIKKESLDQTLTSQLIREIKIQMYIDHPNIVKMYTFFSDSTSIYLVLELCSSGQLYNFLQKHQPVSQDMAKVIIKQICQGLDYLHANHIIHRDLKPQNILYHNSMMKIADFGWSIATPLMRQTFCGTPLYVSPELLKRNYYDNKIDTWSLGVLAFQILIGQVPFEIFCEADYIKILKNQVNFPKYLSISEEAKDFIRKCLQKNPCKRITSSEIIEHPFIKNAQLKIFPQLY